MPTDEALFEQVYDTYGPSLYRFCLLQMKNPADAEDVLHDCFVNVYVSAKGYDSCGKPMAWLFTIARNLCLLRLRERGRTADIPPEDWEDGYGHAADVGPDDRLLLEHCMTRLSDEERQIVVLHAVAGFKHREIAAMLDLALPTVLSKYHRAMKKLGKAAEEAE